MNLEKTGFFFGFLYHVNDFLLAATVLKTKDKHHKLMVLTP